MSDTATAGIGDNNPPEPTEVLRAQLEETHTDLLKRLKDILDGNERVPASCASDDDAAKLSDFIKICTTYMKNSEATRLSANEPYRALIRTIDGFFKANSDAVDKVKEGLTKKLTDYQRAQAAIERQRLQAIADEEARIAKEARAKADEEARKTRELQAAEDRRQAEARKAADALAGAARKKAEDAEAKRQADAAATIKAQEDQAAAAKQTARDAKQDANVAKEGATAKAADLSRNRSTAGSVASLKTDWKFEVVKDELVPRQFLKVDETAIRIAVRAATTDDGKNRLKIPGVKIFPVEGSVVR